VAPRVPTEATGRILVIPAAGIGSRLKSPLPKILVPVAGRPMLAWLIALYRDHVSRIVVVVQPSAEAQVRSYGDTLEVELQYALQPSPTGMIDAILLSREQVEHSDARHVWVTWCDQVAVDPRTAATLAELSSRHDRAALVMPTMMQEHPYIHLARDDHGRIVRVLHRREGDAMPARGESDMGLFSLSREAFLGDLAEFAREGVRGAATGERNFLPFIPWIARRADVVTFPGVHQMEAIGVNTPDERDRVAAHLADRARG
jgi:bifunctional N-acetylglucosamine-1-phosphate-uridyltransferase/glucosamine-1-phosphate-acetyltransferase GlmU-like protein